MRTYDLTPFYRSTVGFDRLFSLLDQATSRPLEGRPNPSHITFVQATTSISKVEC